MLVSVNLVDGASENIVPGVLPLLQDEWGFGDTLGGAIPTAAALIGIVVLLPAVGWPIICAAPASWRSWSVRGP